MILFSKKFSEYVYLYSDPMMNLLSHINLVFSFTQLTLEKCINFIIIIIQRGCNYVINIWFMTKLHTLLSMNFHLKQMNIQQKKISVSIHACNMKSLKLIISFIIEGAIVIFAQCSSNIRHDTVFWC